MIYSNPTIIKNAKCYMTLEHVSPNAGVEMKSDELGNNLIKLKLIINSVHTIAT